MADGVKRLYIYDATDLTDASTTQEFTDFAHQDVAKAGSASFGECEYQAYLDGSMLATDDAALQAAAQGQTLFASSGDQGGFCPWEDTNGIGPGGPPFVSYPTSSPFFVGVGGTPIFSNADFSYGDEIAWYTSGGGTSAFEYQASSLSRRYVPVTGDRCADPRVSRWRAAGACPTSRWTRTRSCRQAPVAYRTPGAHQPSQLARASRAVTTSRLAFNILYEQACSARAIGARVRATCERPTRASVESPGLAVSQAAVAPSGAESPRRSRPALLELRLRRCR